MPSIHGLLETALYVEDVQRAAEFYRHFGFIAFESKPLHLFLPMATMAKAG
jgi:hypothetical protein